MKKLALAIAVLATVAHAAPAKLPRYSSARDLPAGARFSALLGRGEMPLRDAIARGVIQPKCARVSEQIFANVLHYYMADAVLVARDSKRAPLATLNGLVYGTYKNTAQVHAREAQRLVQETFANDRACFADAAISYALASITFSETSFTPATRLDLDTSRPGRGLIGKRLEILAGYLARARVLVPIAPGQRESLGSLWTRKSGGGYDILAAYDCMGPFLLFDPTLPPVDLAATLAHEMEHLVRDKSPEAQAGLASLDEREYLLLDESLAAMRAGVVSMQLVDRMNGESESLVFYFWKDATLFRAGGPLELSFDSSYKNALALVKPSPDMNVYLRRYMSYSDYLAFGPLSPGTPEFEARMSKALIGILDTIGKAYFDVNPPDPAKLASKIRTMNTDALAPLDNAPKASVAETSDAAAYHRIWYPELPDRKSGPLAGDLRQMRAFINGLATGLRKPTDRCRAFERKARDGSLGGYIGAPEDEDEKPLIPRGNEGVVPSRTVKLSRALKACRRPGRGL